MTLKPGTRLAHYEVIRRLGRGGMGEVYRARDTKLGRDVALKVLPKDVASDPDRLARFEQEARTVAALNHPNIVTLHSIEEANGVRFLTMELMEGKTLAEAIPKGGLSPGRLLTLAAPVAAAIAAAHQRGVVHRDLKPDNVMLTDEGTVKVLDFGLAKLQLPAVEGGDAETATRPLTGPKTLLGTLPYMSPEQIQAGSIDHRSDIFSLGVILYELATGKRPFRGDSAAELISVILRDTPPPVTEIKGDLPDQLARIVRRCLEKDPKRRYQSALDLANDLDDLKMETSAPRPAPPIPRPARRPWVMAAGVALALLVAAVG